MASKKPPSSASKAGASRQNVRVICRIRPVNQKEIQNGGVTCVNYTDTAIEVKGEEGKNDFSFDRVFGPESTQVGVFEYAASSIITDVLAGYNATIFAYGQTGTGKTHTMEGVITDPDLKGIIPRTVDALFDGVSEADESIEFTFKVSYVEIYLEKIRDLLDEHRLKNNLTVREDKIKGIYIAGVTEEYVTSEEELLEIMTMGANNRAVAATGMNEGSSRSHSVFTITVGQKDMNTNATRSGKLVLVDLAGSEMVRKSNASGQQLEEAKTINKSLSALGQVINALTDEKATHVPYRDSKLTRVLQDSLGGNSKTVLIINVSPSSFNAPETVSTLRFGNRAKSIENKVQINQTRSVEELEALLVRAEKAIDAQTAHIISLSTQLQALQAAQSSAIREDFDTDNESDDKANKLNGDLAAATAEARAQARAEAEAAALAQLQESSIAVAKLQETVASLTQELDEERQESTRKDNELKSLAGLLKDKDRLIQDAASMLSDVQRSNENLRERSEQLLREKIEAVGELESLRGIMEEEINKSKFNLMELEVTLNTLETENKQLKKEISDMSGDASTKSPTFMSNNFNNDAPEPVSKKNLGRRSVDNQFEENVLSGVAVGNRKELMDEFTIQFEAACNKHKLSPEASAELFALVDYITVEQDKNLQAMEDKNTTKEKAAAKRIRDLEDQRSRLEKDLQNRVETMIQLQVKFDTLGRMDGRQFTDNMAEKDRAHMRSLQQRLEQLVAVHRQLLRKFASLELENNEVKKKTMLRDERIRQLEGNSRGLIGNIRQQAEKHVAELTKLREQIGLMKVEHEQRLEAMKQDGGFFNQSSPRVPNRLHQQRTLRGGGGASKSFYNMDMAVLQGGTPVAKQSSMGARPLPNTPPVTQPIRGGGSQDAFASVNAAPPYASPPPAKGSSVLSRFLGNK